MEFFVVVVLAFTLEILGVRDKVCQCPTQVESNDQCVSSPTGVHSNEEKAEEKQTLFQPAKDPDTDSSGS
jgi:hypothetical protein